MERIRDYDLIEQIHTTSLGVCYKARNIKTNSLCFVKVSGIETFIKNEVEILSNIDYPFIPKVFDYFEYKGKHYVVTEYISGSNLENLITNNLIDKEMIQYVVREVCQILKYLNEELFIIHNDIKPTNIMMNEHGFVYLVDFGCSNFMNNMKIQTDRHRAALMNVYTEENKQTIDMFALGRFLFQTLTGYDTQKLAIVMPYSMINSLISNFVDKETIYFIMRSQMKIERFTFSEAIHILHKDYKVDLKEYFRIKRILDSEESIGGESISEQTIIRQQRMYSELPQINEQTMPLNIL